MNNSEFINYVKANGVDCDTALGYFAGNEAFYLKFLKALRVYMPIDELVDSCNKGDSTRAFEAVHSLKSTTGNLGLTLLYQTACKMTEHFRSHEDEAGFALLDTFVKEYNRILDLVDNGLLL